MEFSSHKLEQQRTPGIPLAEMSALFEQHGSQGEITAPGGGADELASTPLKPAATPAENTENVTPVEVAKVLSQPSKWKNYELTERATGHIIRGWVPAAAEMHDPLKDSVEVQIGDTLRQIDTRVLDRAVEFNNAFTERAALGHNCSTFAYACSSGDSVTDLVATEDSGTSFSISEVMIATESPEEVIAQGTADHLEAGTIIALSTAHGKEFFTGNTHYMVKATTDEGKALFLSKFGSETYVVLTDLAEAVTAYGAQNIARIGAIQPVYLERLSASEK
jgi:hypothetical protein